MNTPPPHPDATRHAAEYAAAARTQRRWAVCWSLVTLAAFSMWVASMFRVPHEWWSMPQHRLWVDLRGELAPVPIVDGVPSWSQPQPVNIPHERAAFVEIGVELAVPLAETPNYSWRSRRMNRSYEPWSRDNPPPGEVLDRAIATAVSVRVLVPTASHTASAPSMSDDSGAQRQQPGTAPTTDVSPFTRDGARRAALEQAARAFEGTLWPHNVPAAIRAGGTEGVPLPYFKSGPLWAGWMFFLWMPPAVLATRAWLRAVAEIPPAPLEHIA